MDKVIESIIDEVAAKHNVDRKEVMKVLVMPYKMMREKIQALELRGKLYKECEGMKTNFTMPVLFKMHLNEYKINELNTIKEDE